MMAKKFLSLILFLSFLTVTSALVPLVLAATEHLIVELDKTEAYPSQNVLITVCYQVTLSEGETFTISSRVINMEITTSGLVDTIETTDYLLNRFIGTQAVSGKKYEACNMTIHIPDDHGNYGVEEKTYAVTIDNLRDYSNVVQLKILAVKEKLSIEMNKAKVSPGDNVTITVKYTLDAPSDVTLIRPLNTLKISLEGIREEVTPPLIFPAEVTGGQEITLTTHEIQIPKDTEPKNYAIKAYANPPNLETNSITLNVQQSSSTRAQPVLSNQDILILLAVLAVAIGGGYTLLRRRRGGGIDGEELDLPEDILPPGNLIASADPEQENVLWQLYRDSGLKWFVDGIKQRHTEEAFEAAERRDEIARKAISDLKKRRSIFGPGSFRKMGLQWALNKHLPEEKVGQLILREMERANAKEWGKFMVQSLKTLDKLGPSLAGGGTSEVPDSRFKVPVWNRDLKALKGHDIPLKKFAKKIGTRFIRDHSGIADAVVDRVQPDTYYMFELIEKALYQDDAMMNKAQQIFKKRYGESPSSSNPEHVKNWIKIMKDLQR